MDELSKVRTFLSSLLVPSASHSLELPLPALTILSNLADAYYSHKKQDELLLKLIACEKSRLEWETTRLRYVLKDIVSPVSPSDGLASILARMSDLLDVEEPTFDAIFMALAKLRLRTCQIGLQVQEDDLGQKALELIAESEKIKRDAKKATKETQSQYEQTLASSSKLSFLREKRVEYEMRLKKNEKRLHRHPLITHEQVVALNKELEEKRAVLEPLQKSFAAMQELPPDFELAKLKVAQAKERLDDLDRQLGDKISQLQL